MEELNKRLVKKVGKWRNLDSENQRLRAELEKLKSQQNNEATRVRLQYQRMLEEKSVRISEFEQKCDDFENENIKLKQQIRDLENRSVKINLSKLHRKNE